MSTQPALLDASARAAGTWAPSLRDALRRPLPAAGGILDRVLLRTAAIVAQRQAVSVHGLDGVMPDRDPFIIALNHSTRLEAVLVPALIMHARGGRRLHFLADWNFALLPGVAMLYRRSGVICVTRKPARPRFLNIFRTAFETEEGSFELAKARLRAGGSVGIFPEGTANGDPGRLLRGRFGAARLSLETGVPVVPAGLRYAIGPETAHIPETARFALHVGPAMHPASCAAPRAPHTRVKDWHAQIMNAISHLSGKSWRPFPDSAHLGGKP